MKTSIRTLICGLFLTSTSWAMDADFSGYMRGGSGSGLYGGKQECFYNAGIPGNFLRLGNECSFYTELTMVFNHLKSTAQDPLYFRTQLRIEFDSLGLRQWEAAPQPGGAPNQSINQIEAFVQAGGFSEFSGAVWVGKRFYRDVDVHIFDWYYYGDMSGVGAGIDDVPLGSGQLAFAQLLQASDTVSNSSVGRPLLQALDLRWKNVVLNEDNKLNLWAAYAWAPRGKDASGNEYVKTNGYSLSTKINSHFWGANNNFALMYGRGALKDFNLYGSSSVNANNDNQNRAWTWRLVNDWVHDVNDKWALGFALAATKGNSGASQDGDLEWEEVGARPIYYFSDRMQLAFEGGMSQINDRSQKDANGVAVGDRMLTRLTIAPQIGFSKSFWGRPVLRAFVTHSFWNDANKDSIAKSAPSTAGQTAGTSLGTQFEVWY